MYIIRRILTALITGSLIPAPVAVSACGYGADGTGGVFETPVSMRGHFVFIKKISQRSIRHTITDQLQVQQRGVREQI